jgi:hypothetical protein
MAALIAAELFYQLQCFSFCQLHLAIPLSFGGELDLIVELCAYAPSFNPCKYK